MSQIDDSPRARAVAAPPGAGAAMARTPDFFIVGHQKCGTTALYMMLGQHPEIFMPDIKEPWYFGRELRSRFAKPSNRSRPNTLDDYLELFADAEPGQIAGEASPQYIRSASAAREIAALRRDARIVVILREPTAFLRSLHLQMVVTHDEDEPDFAKALALEQLRRAGERIPTRTNTPQTLLYSDHVRYTEQLERLHESFPAEQVLVLIYEDFRRDNAATVARVLEFLGVDAGFEPEPVETRKLEDIRSMRLHRLRRAIRQAGLNPAKRGRLVRTVDAIAPKPLDSRSIAKAFRQVAYRAQRPPDEKLILELRRRFKPEVVSISERLDRDLVALWGYEDIS
jgi:Sulfotransferase domain